MRSPSIIQPACRLAKLKEIRWCGVGKGLGRSLEETELLQEEMGPRLIRQQKEVRIQQLLLMKGVEQEQAKGEECTICMQRQSKASINGCAHHFCIRCIRRWSKTKNTCPLCRERYHEIRYRNKVIPVAQPPTPHRPVRAPVLPAGQQQRRIVYVPFFLYPQQHCLVYQAPSYYLLPPAVEESAGGYSLSLPGPSFFVPTL